MMRVQQANVLASIGGDGTLILWRISEGADTGNNTNEIVHEVKTPRACG